MTRHYKIYHVDAFTTQPFGGNAAGVVPMADGLTDQEMQNIAREMSLPETAFLFTTDVPGADYRVRFFTPGNEIDFCGHATIGSAWMLSTEYGWAEKAEQVVLQTNIGPVPVKWNKDGDRVTAVEMTQVAPKVKRPEESAEEICRAIGISVDDLDDRYPIALGNTGNWHLLIPVKTRAAIDAVQPNFDAIKAMNRGQNVATTHLFTFDGGEDLDVYTRDFAPAMAISEDPVTGSANGALAGYLVLEGILNPSETHRLVFGQGHKVGRPGFLQVTITPGESHPVIQIGGSAVPTIAGTLTLPE
jgi:trans-2,3-dihydro-3-hydroxyanthranilate isomerase